MISKNDKELMELYDAMREDRLEANKEEQKRAKILAVGKWIADHIVETCALVVAIIALMRTF